MPGSSRIEDEEDLSSGGSSVDSYEKNDDLMIILSKGKIVFKDTYEDPIRMYLKEIGDVKLLSRKDEEVLARTIDLKFKYKNLSSELEESSPDLINSGHILREVLSSILGLEEIINAIGKFYGKSHKETMSLTEITSEDSFLNQIHGIYAEDLVVFVADVNNIPDDEVTKKIKELFKKTSEPTTIKTENSENIIKFKIKLKLPLFSSLLSLTYLEKSPKLTIIIEKYAKIVPATVINGIILSGIKKF